MTFARTVLPSKMEMSKSERTMRRRLAGPPFEVDKIAQRRRGSPRYTLRLDVKWKLIRAERVLQTGSGHTLDLSRGGVLFDAGRPLPEGLKVEVAIAWPVLLDDQTPLHLAISGRIKRSRENLVAIQTIRYAFHTGKVQL